MFDAVGKKQLLWGSVLLALLMLFIVFGPPKLLERTSLPAFCNVCHVMNPEHEAWFLTGLHRNIRCVDCHLPNDNIVNHLVWKGIDGTKDVLYFYGRLYHDIINISDHGKNTVQKNCVRCHGEMVSRMNTDGRYCWDCHRRVNHRIAEYALFPDAPVPGRNRNNDK